MGAPVPFKRLASPSLGKMLQPEASGTANIQVPYLKAGHVQWRGVDLPEDLPLMWASPADVKDLTPASGDLLICEGGEVGRAALTPAGLPKNTIIQNSLHLVRETDSACPRYLKYALEHVAASGWIDLICNKATIAHLTVDKLRELPIPYWGKQGQERIANFLDEQTARIDALIAEKERLNESLAEWHSAELTRHCFGSDQLQIGTGNPWIPSLPNGWKAMRIKHLVNGIEQGWSPECESRLADEEEWGVLKAGAANGGTYREDEHKALPCSLEPIPSLEVKVGDVLITRASGTAEYVGSFAFVHQTRSKLMLSDKNFRLKFDAAPKLLPELLALTANTYAVRQQILQYVSGADGLAKNIGSGNLREVWLPVPPEEEQPKIVSRLKKAREHSVSLSLHLAEHIARLREYRSSLISAAVTGQLDLSTFKKAVQ